MTNPYVSALILVAIFAFAWWGNRQPDPPKAPARPVVASSDGEWLALPFQLIAGLAGLAWCLVGLAVFLSPLLILVWLVAR